MKKYRFLLFDADNTLLDFDENERVSISETFRHFGFPDDEKTVKEYHEINRYYWKLYDEKKISRDDLLIERFVTLYKRHNADISPVETEKFYRSQLNLGMQVIDGALELISDLKKDGYTVIITTNGVASTQHNRLLGSGIQNIADAIFISEEIGSHKPEKAYFDFVTEHTVGFDGTKALVIGDSLSSDIEGGINAGIDTCWYNPKNEENTKDFTPTYEVRNFDEIRKILQ